MAKLPIRPHQFYVGIDPGYKGAIHWVNRSATAFVVEDMPVEKAGSGKDREREIDLEALDWIFARIRRLPDAAIGLEWPTTRPGEGAERSKRFGVGLGILLAYCHASGHPYFLIPPQTWKGRLRLPGKTVYDADKIVAARVREAYPQHVSKVLGPRGGILDGRCDAVLIAYFLRKLHL